LRQKTLLSQVFRLVRILMEVSDFRSGHKRAATLGGPYKNTLPTPLSVVRDN
jgi:hypothetical protein